MTNPGRVFVEGKVDLCSRVAATRVKLVTRQFYLAQRESDVVILSAKEIAAYNQAVREYIRGDKGV